MVCSPGFRERPITHPPGSMCVRFLALVLCQLRIVFAQPSCADGIARPSTNAGIYHLQAPVTLNQLDAKRVSLLEKLNRADRVHLLRLGKLIVPDCWDLEEIEYSPLPPFVAGLEPYKKLVLVHLPSQVFGAYEHGRIVRWGPVSSGRAQHPSPTGVFFLNWRSPQRASTDNSNWLLNWYFNFHNRRGLAFHEFALPGLPASHACIRLLRRDAQWLFGWGEEWELGSEGRDVLNHGTPVWIVGEYDFSSAPPWLKPEWWDAPIRLPEKLSSLP